MALQVSHIDVGAIVDRLLRFARQRFWYWQNENREHTMHSEKFIRTDCSATAQSFHEISFPPALLSHDWLDHPKRLLEPGMLTSKKEVENRSSFKSGTRGPRIR